MSVVIKQRVAGRICAANDVDDRVCALLGELGLRCHRSAVDLLPMPDLIGGRIVSHNARLVPRGADKRGRAVIYYGIEREFARGVEAVELARDSNMAGCLFGYPECCVQFFANNQGEAGDRTPASIPDTGPFDTLLNPLLAELYGVRLHFHFACSPRCSASQEIAKRHLNYLRQYAPSIDMLTTLGKGIMVYGPKTGAALISRYSQKGEDTFNVHEVTTWDERPYAIFRGARQPSVRLHSARHFEINGQTFAGGNHCAGLFVGTVGSGH